MTKEQAVERSNKIITTKFNNDYSIDNVDKEAIEIVLSMLEEQDKTIDLMSETINNHDIDEDVCKRMGQKANCNEYEDAKECKECIKQYFINKAKEIR